MANFQCTECLKVLPTVQHHDNDVCHPCARDLGYIEPADYEKLHAERNRVEAERQRLAAEKKAEFDAQAEARKELAEREIARRRLLPFIKRMMPDYEPGWVHADICARLEKFAQDVIDRKSPRLMLFLPPRAGKSAIGSQMFPAWFLGKYPKLTAIISSYSGDLAEGFSRSVRNMFENEKFLQVFPKARLSKDSKSASKWATTAGGSMNAVGVSGSLSGKGGHILVVDDPIKDRAEAESELVRQNLKDWYSSTFLTRKAPGAGILVIQTRWHSDDLAGWLMSLQAEREKEEAEGGSPYYDRWEVVSYPAIAEEDEKYRKAGEALHPERFPLEELLTTKSGMLPRDWAALYQQRPTLEDGEFFTRDMFRFYRPGDAPPIQDMRVYAACDLAISTKQTADYSVFVVVGIDREQNIWVLDLQRKRVNALGIIDTLFDIQLNWKPDLIGIETGQIELTLEPFIQKAEHERRVTLRYEKLRTRGADKGTRARPIQGRMEQGKVFFPAVDTVNWMEVLMNEFLAFPLGTHDDIVDALAWIGQMIMLFGIRNQKLPPKKPSWKDKLIKYGVTGERHRSPMSA